MNEPAQTQSNRFRFRLTTGEEPQIVFPVDVVFDGRRSRAGRVVMQFPEPFAHIQLVEGERVGSRKWDSIRSACLSLGATIQ